MRLVLIILDKNITLGYYVMVIAYYYGAQMGITFVENYENLPDSELIRLYNAADDYAISVLLKRYSGMVLSRVSAYLSHYDFLESDDLYQEGMIAVYFAIKSFDFKSSSFSTFARLCIDRAIIDLIRKSYSKKSVPQSMLVEFEDVPVDLSLSPEQICLGKEKLLEFNKKLKTVLSDKEYTVLVAYLSGSSYIEIANKLNISEKAVDNALYRIKRKLK